MAIERSFVQTEAVSASTSSVKDQLLPNFLESKDYRHAFIEEKVRTNIAVQINAIREQRGMTQSELGKAMGKSQSWITRLEDPNQSPPTIPSLLQVAEALDVDLDIRFAPFSRFLNSVDQMDPDSFTAPSFEDEYGTPEQQEAAAEATAMVLQRLSDEMQKAMGLPRGIDLHAIERSIESMMRPLAPILSEKSGAFETLGVSLQQIVASLREYDHTWISKYEEGIRQTYQAPIDPIGAAAAAQVATVLAPNKQTGGVANMIPFQKPPTEESPYTLIHPPIAGAASGLRIPA